MVNLNECKLGDKLKMRNGELAIYVGRDPHCVIPCDTKKLKPVRDT